MIGLVVCWVIGALIGTVFYYMRAGARAVISGPQPLPDWEQAAGRIHLFKEDRYLNSSVSNAYEHPSLNWATGQIGCGFAADLQAHPAFQAALIGTIQIFKPERNRGHVAVILDNRVLAALGLAPVGLNTSAQQLVDRVIPEQTIRSH